MLRGMGALGAPELLIILVIILLVFGGAKLPKLAKSLGQAQREFRKGTDAAADDDDDAAKNRASDKPEGKPSA